MKNIIIATFLLTSATAYAQSQTMWVPLSNSTYMLPPAEGTKVLLSATVDTHTKRVAINVMDLSGVVCKENDSHQLEAASPISINGKYVKVMSACLNGIQIIQPESAAGKAFLNNLLESETPVALDIGRGQVLHYATSGTKAIVKKLMAAENAM